MSLPSLVSYTQSASVFILGLGNMFYLEKRQGGLRCLRMRWTQRRVLSLEFPGCKASFDHVEFLLWWADMRSACWICSVSPVGMSITVDVSLCCLGLTLMWYHACVVVIGCGATMLNLGIDLSLLHVEGDL